MPVRDYLRPFEVKPFHGLPYATVKLIQDAMEVYRTTKVRQLDKAPPDLQEHIYESCQRYLERIYINLNASYLGLEDNQLVADFTRGMIFDCALLHAGAFLAGFNVEEKFPYQSELAFITQHLRKENHE